MLEDMPAVPNPVGVIVVLMASNAVIVAVVQATEPSAGGDAVTQGTFVVVTSAVPQGRRVVVKGAVSQGRHVVAARAVQVTVAVTYAVVQAFPAAVIDAEVYFHLRVRLNHHRRRTVALLGLRPAVCRTVVG
jgi:hypothetical protein